MGRINGLFLTRIVRADELVFEIQANVFKKNYFNVTFAGIFMGRVIKSLFYVNIRGKNYFFAGFSWISAAELFVCGFYTNLCSRTPLLRIHLRESE